MKIWWILLAIILNFSESVSYGDEDSEQWIDPSTVLSNPLVNDTLNILVYISNLHLNDFLKKTTTVPPEVDRVEDDQVGIEIDQVEDNRVGTETDQRGTTEEIDPVSTTSAKQHSAEHNGGSSELFSSTFLIFTLNCAVLMNILF